MLRCLGLRVDRSVALSVAWIVLATCVGFADASAPTPLACVLDFCGCTQSCALMQSGNVTCDAASESFLYTERHQFTCAENPGLCELEQLSYGVALQPYQLQSLILRANTSIDCTTGSYVTGYAINCSVLFNATLTQASPSSCALDLPVLNGNGRAYFGLQRLLSEGDSTQLSIASQLPEEPPTFDVAFTTVNDLAAFTLTPLYGCCLGSPDNLTVVAGLCDAVTFVNNDGIYEASRAFLLECSASRVDYGNRTQYFFNVNIVGNATGLCSDVGINDDVFNATQIIVDTQSPTYSPSISPDDLSVAIVSPQVVSDTDLCPISVSGFARPRVTVNATSALVAQFVAATLWFPPTLWVADYLGDNAWIVTSSACVAQDSACRVRAMNATARVEAALNPSTELVATASEAYTDLAVQCQRRSPCYPGEALNVNAFLPPQITVTLPTPFSFDEQWIVDLSVPGVTVDPELFVTFDTLSLTVTNLDTLTVWSQDVSSKYKDVVMRNLSYPEYYDGNFCRYNDTLFYVDPIRWNAYVAANIEGINATVCAYLSDVSVDRFTFTPSRWVFVAASCVRCSLRFEVTGQVRRRGTLGGFPLSIQNTSQITVDQPGCVWKEETIIIDVAPSVPVRISVAVPLVIAISIFCGLNLLPNLLDWLRKRAAEHRRQAQAAKRKVTKKPADEGQIGGQPTEEDKTGKKGA